jgi:hypothetical protein
MLKEAGCALALSNTPLHWQEDFEAMAGGRDWSAASAQPDRGRLPAVCPVTAFGGPVREGKEPLGPRPHHYPLVRGRQPMSTAFTLIGLGLAFLIGIIVGIVIQSDNGPDYDE